MHDATSNNLPVAFSLGMGLHSSIALAELCEWPELFRVDLARLVVFIAQTGAEGEATKRQMETLLFPLLRQRGVRVVQVARAGSSVRQHGIIVLDDTREPTVCHTKGNFFSLYDELVGAGTVPTYAKGNRLCSIHAKGEVLDAAMGHIFGGQPFRHMIGFHAGELSRVERDRSYSSATRLSEYPLLQLGWDDAACRAASLKRFGEVITKSACSFCCFPSVSGGLATMLARYREEPAAGAETVFLEHIALALNPRSSLYSGGRRVRDEVRKAGLSAVWDAYEARLRACSWAVYRVRRILPLSGQANRCLKRVATFKTADEAVRHLTGLAVSHGLALEQESADVTLRLWLRRRESKPTVEEFLAICPAIPADKAVPGFEKLWAQATSMQYALALA